MITALAVVAVAYLLVCLLAVTGRWETVLAVLLAFALGQLHLRRRSLALGFSLGPDVVDVLARRALRAAWQRARH